EPDSPLERVGLLGPTDQYADHVRTVRDELSSTGVDVFSIRSLMRELAAVNTMEEGPDKSIDTEWAIGRTLERCAIALRGARLLNRSNRQNMRTLVNGFIE